jgi:RNA polymerase sigma factor (sigma-70 family)
LEIRADGEAPVQENFEQGLIEAMPTLRRLARVLVAQADCDDLLQDTLARAWTKRALFNPDRGALRTWLTAIMADQARGRWRMRQADYRLVGWAAPASSSFVEQIDLRSAVDRLPRRQRAAVVLFYYVDLPVSEVADLLSCSTGTVKSALFDARKRLSREIGDHAGH